MAAETMLHVARGNDPVAEKRAQRSSGTFADLVQRYLDEHAKKNNRSWRQADALVRRFALPRWRDSQAASISRTDVKTMMSTIEKPSVATQTIRHISAIFAWAKREDLLSVNRAVPWRRTSPTIASVCSPTRRSRHFGMRSTTSTACTLWRCA